MTSAAATKRTGNRRGFGGNLRDEIIAAAERLLAEGGSRDAVTLRAIAREAGIAAPSIYPHFADRDAILDEVVSRAFTSIASTCQDAADAADAGIDRVQAISDAFIRFAREHPGRYRILFERSPANIASPPHPYREGLLAFDLIVQALTHVANEQPAGELIPGIAAQGLFAALHGIATLRPALPGFPWTAEATLVHDAVVNACRPASTTT